MPVSRFDEMIGTQWISDDPDRAIAAFEVREELLQPVGLVHGGVLSSVIESVCSRVTALEVLADGRMAMGQSIAVSFLRSITEGRVEVRASARHRGGTSWVWDADAYDDRERLCATGKMTVAVRELPDEVIRDYGPSDR